MANYLNTIAAYGEIMLAISSIFQITIILFSYCSERSLFQDMVAVSGRKLAPPPLPTPQTLPCEKGWHIAKLRYSRTSRFSVILFVKFVKFDK